jgi:hypothetical protein
MARMMLDPAIGILTIAAIALLFASAGVHKLRDIRRFDEIFTAYGVLPLLTRMHLSRLVPVLEVGVATGVLVDSCRPYAVAVGVILLLAYAAAIAVNLRRGRRDLACGCGGPDERRPIAAWMVWRNVFIALVLAGMLTPWTSRPLTFTDGVTIAFGLLTIALIYLCIDQLLGYAQRAAQPRGIR